MNWIVCLTRNNLQLTQRAIQSFRAQDIEGGVRILVVENASDDNTCAWLATQPDITTIFNRPQVGVAGGWNQACRWLMNWKWDTSVRPPMPLPPMCDYVLVCNNDVVLRPDTYRWLVADGGGFVTAVGTRDKERIKPSYILSMDIKDMDIKDFENTMAGDIAFAKEDLRLEYLAPDPSAKRPHPDFSCFLIRRSTWETVGEFNEQYFPAFCEDADYHLRMHRAGIRAEALELPFYHAGSATVNNADANEQRYIRRQADKNRELFRATYGFGVGSGEYYRAFGHGQPPEDVPPL